MYIVNLAEQGQNVSRIFYCVIMFKKTLMDTENTIRNHYGVSKHLFNVELGDNTPITITIVNCSTITIVNISQ